MRLIKLRIHNFRGIIDQEIALKTYTLLVGPNNSGKSTIIDALRAFYEKDGFKYRHECDFPHIPTSEDDSWIELEFSLTDDEYNSLAAEYQTGSKILRVRKYYTTETQTHDGKSAAGLVFAYKSDGTLSTESFYGAKNVQSGKFGDLIFVPAISKVDEHTKLTGPSALRDLLNDVMSEVVERSKAYSDFDASVAGFSDSIRDETTHDGRCLADLELQLNKLLLSWQATFNIKFSTPSASEIIKSMVS